VALLRLLYRLTNCTKKLSAVGTSDAAVMELRLTRKADFVGQMDVIEIPEEFIPLQRNGDKAI
jgi:hypothetical protein